MKRILIIGGYGNFGSFISRRLASTPNLHIIIAGRSFEKATCLATELQSDTNSVEGIALDITKNLSDALASIKPDIVIHTSGPFQAQDPFVAKACIAQGCHYIDLADGRDFVARIGALDQEARDKKVLVVTGASSVPCLTSTLLDHYKSKFRAMEGVDYGITTAQKTARGVATTSAILSYTGQPFKTLIDGKMREVHGWQDIHVRKYPHIGRRLLGNCNVPDLDLFPKRYPDLKTIRFYAGLEVPLIHFTLWMLSWGVRFKLVRRLETWAPALLKLSFMFDWLGSSTSAFHLEITGTGHDDAKKNVVFDLTARAGDGPYIPCMPAILMAQKLARGTLTKTGAYPCTGFITLDEYLDALSDLEISWEISGV